MNIKRIIGTLATASALFGQAATLHVDSAGGDDAADGASPATAWRTLDRVNKATLAPGDRVLFKRGGLCFQFLDLLFKFKQFFYSVVNHSICHFGSLLWSCVCAPLCIFTGL